MLAFCSLGLTACFVLPAGASYDEPNHIARIDQIANGTLVAEKIDYGAIEEGYRPPESNNGAIYGGEVDKALYSLAQDNMTTYHTTKNRFSLCDLLGKGTQATYNYGNASAVYAFSNTAVNSPVFYLPYYPGYFLGKLFFGNALGIILSMRVSCLLFTSFAFVFLMRLAPWGRRSLCLIFCLPQTIFCLSSISADAFTIVVCVAFIFSVTWIALGDNRKTVFTTFIVSLCLLGSTKVTYILLGSLVIMLTLGNAHLSPQRKRIANVSLLIALATSALWFGVVAEINTGAIFKTDVNPGEQIKFATTHPLIFANALLDSLIHANLFQVGANTVIAFRINGEIFFTVFATLCALFADLISSEAPNKAFARQIAIWYLSLLLIAASAISLSLYLQFTGVGERFIEGVQNRYYIPLLPLAVIPMLLFFAPLFAPYNNRAKSCSKLGFAERASSFSLLAMSCANIFLLLESVFAI